MRRDRRLARQARLESSATFIYCKPIVSSLINKGTIMTVNGVKYMTSRYRSDQAALIAEEKPNFPKSEPTITLDK